MWMAVPGMGMDCLFHYTLKGVVLARLAKESNTEVVLWFCFQHLFSLGHWLKIKETNLRNPEYSFNQRTRTK